jgi:outer membrane protein assembly factor BamD (BamD/ComL family)
MKILTFVLISFFIFAGCNTYEDENRELKNRNEQLERRADSLENSPAYLYGLAYDHIQNQNYDEAKAVLFDLNRKYPSWNQNMVIESINHVNRLQNPEGDLLRK